MVFDDAHNLAAFNAAYCELLGYSREELLELKADGHIPGGGGEHGGTAGVRRKDGAVVPVGYRLIETNVSALPYTIALLWPS